MLRYTDRDGRERFYTFGEYPDTSLADARQEAAKLRARSRTDGRLEKPRDQEVARRGTVRELLTGYVDDMRDRGKISADQVQARLENHVSNRIGGRIAGEVTESEINAVLAIVYKAGHRPLANRLRSYILSAYKWGRRHDKDYRYQGDGVIYGITLNPAADIPRDSAGERVEDRVLSWHEIRVLWHACSDVLSLEAKMVCQLNLAVGGHRSGEILGICDNEIDQAQHLWRIPGTRTKNGRENVIPLTDLALQLLEQARFYRGNSRYLFPMRGDDKQSMRVDSFYSAIRKYCLRVPGDTWTPKDIRTTFKTRGGEVGLSKDIRDRIQNHAMTDVSSRHYDMWTYLPEKRAALEKWQAVLLEKTGRHHPISRSSRR
jgi:integrase